MHSLTPEQTRIIESDVRSVGIAYSHLAEELIDHLCCEIEMLLEKGHDFTNAYKQVKEEIPGMVLKEVEDETKMFLNKTYRIMKTTIKFIGLAGLTLVAFGSLFKTMHWPGANIGVVLGFVLLALVFFPAAMYVLKKETKIRGGRFIYLAALAGGVLFMIGILFKLMHWPGAYWLLLSGFVTLSIVFLPSLLISKLLSESGKPMRVTNILGAVIVLAILSGECAIIFHWQFGKSILFAGVLALSMIWLPLYAHKAYKNSTYVKGSFLYICIGIIFFSFLNIIISSNMSKDPNKDFCEQGRFYNQQLATLEKARHDFNLSLIKDSLPNYKNLAATSSLISSNADLLCQQIDSLKIELIMTTSNLSKQEAITASGNPYLLKEKQEIEKTSYFMCGDPYGQRKGKATELKVALNEFKEILEGIVSGDETDKEFITELLATSEPASDEKRYEEDATWEEHTFFRMPAIAVINKLTRIQRNIRISERIAARHLANSYNSSPGLLSNQ